MPAGVYSGGGVTVVMEPPPVIYVKVSGKGTPVDRNMKSRARDVAVLARDLAPFGRTGQLKAGIHASQSRDERGRYAFGYVVYSLAPHTIYVHEGTAPHEILPVNGEFMKFAGTNGYAGQIVYTRHVNHPGNRSNPFLTKALIAMGG